MAEVLAALGDDIIAETASHSRTLQAYIRSSLRYEALQPTAEVRLRRMPHGSRAGAAENPIIAVTPARTTRTS